MTIDEDTTGYGDLESAYARYGTDLVRFAAVLVGPTDAADVVSEALVGCVRDADSWNTILDPRAYLYGAVCNQAKQWNRSRQRRLVRDGRWSRTRIPTATFEFDPEIWAAVRKLSVKQRAVLFLTYWEDLTPVETAARLGLAEGSVRSHLARARLRLRKELQR